MFSDCTRLEQFMFIDNREFCDYIVQDIDAEIALLEEGNANLFRTASGHRKTISDLSKWIGEDVEKYRAYVISDFVNKIDMYEMFLEKGSALLKKLIAEKKSIDTAKLSAFPADTKAVMLRYIDYEIKSIEDRSKDISASIRTFQKDKNIHEKLPGEKLIQSIVNIIAFEKKYLEGNEQSIESNKEQIKIFSAARELFLFRRKHLLV